MKYAGFLTMYFGCLLSVLGQQPVLSWIKTIGGTGSDTGSIITSDAEGNLLIAGNFHGTVDFNPGGDAIYLESSSGSWSNFIFKVTSDGEVLWVKNIGSTGLGVITGLVVEESGSIFITGTFYGTSDFDPGTDVFNLTSSGGRDIFVLKLDTDGNFIWAMAFGSSSDDYVGGIDLDEQGNIYLFGSFTFTVDFDPGPDSQLLTSFYSDPFTGVPNTSDGFIMKMTNDGDFLWVRQIGSEDVHDGISDIEVTTDSFIYLVGFFYFGPAGLLSFSGEPLGLISEGSSDVFMLKLNSDGDVILANSFGGPMQEISSQIRCTNSGDVIVYGGFKDSVVFADGNSNDEVISVGGTDVFIAKFDSLLTFQWVRSAGGAQNDLSLSLDFDATYIYLGGAFKHTIDFDSQLQGGEGHTATSYGENDIFLWILDHAGNFVWAWTTGSVSLDALKSVFADGEGNVYLTGVFSDEVDFGLNGVPNILSSNGNSDAFLLKLSTDSLDIGVSKPQNQKGIAVWPNPSTGLFNIQTPTHLQNAFVAVHDLTGRQVYHARISGANHTIDLSAVPTGLYILSIGEGREAQRIKILKE